MGSVLLFAFSVDGAAFLADSKEEMQLIVTIVDEVISAFGQEISKKKTLILCGVCNGVKVEAKGSCIVIDSDQFDIILGTPSIYGDEGIHQLLIAMLQDLGREARVQCESVHDEQ